MSSHALWLEEVSVVRGKNTVVKKVSLEIPQGKITGLLGPSGSGKTTLLRAIVGVQQKVQGPPSSSGNQQDHYHCARVLRTPPKTAACSPT